MARPSAARRALDGILLPIIAATVRRLYRLRRRGGPLPDGPCLVACNHVSFIDALVVAAALGRPIRFVMHHRLYFAPGLHWLMRACGVIPIAPRRGDPARLDAAWARIDRCLLDGETVGIFPEGGITRHGDLDEFRPGIERIVARRPVPVVPVAIRGMWGSFFSRKHGPAMRRLPRRWRARVEVVVGDAIAAPDVAADALRDHVAHLRGAVC